MACGNFENLHATLKNVVCSPKSKLCEVKKSDVLLEALVREIVVVPEVLVAEEQAKRLVIVRVVVERVEIHPLRLLDVASARIDRRSIPGRP